MTTKRILLVIAIVALAAVIVGGSLARRGERASAGAGDAAVTAPNRMHEVQGPGGEEAAIVLAPAVRQRIGIETRVLRATARARMVRLTGELIASPSQTTTIQSLIAGRLTADDGHWPALGEHVAAGSVLGRVSDARPLVAPRSGTVTRVSAMPGELVQAGQELVQITDFGQLLARIIWRPGAPSPPATITLAPFGGSAAMSATAHLIGAAAQVDTLTRQPVSIYRANGAWPGARPGAPVVATFAQPGTTGRGIVVPTDAVVQWEGLAWAYVQHGADTAGARFVRRRVDTREPVPGGWLVTSADPLGVHPGDTVVVRGAQELLSEEFRSRITVGDEDQP